MIVINGSNYSYTKSSNLQSGSYSPSSSVHLKGDSKVGETVIVVSEERNLELTGVEETAALSFFAEVTGNNSNSFV